MVLRKLKCNFKWRGGLFLKESYYAVIAKDIFSMPYVCVDFPTYKEAEECLRENLVPGSVGKIVHVFYTLG